MAEQYETGCDCVRLLSASGTSSIRSSYVRYKESTQKLVRWLVTTVSSLTSKEDENASAKGSPSPHSAKKKNGKTKKSGKKATNNSAGPDLTDNPVISIKNFVQYASLITNSDPKIDVPEAVFSLFESVIQARKMVAAFYKQLSVTPEVEAKNESHMAFIRVLEEAFDILGGSAWRDRSPEEKKNAAFTRRRKDSVEEEEDNAIHLSNRFAELEVEYKDLGDEADAEEKAEGARTNEWISHLVQNQKPAKGKKAKAAKVKPLSSYKISEDLSDEEEVSFAVWCFFVDMNSVRQYLKAVWNQVRKDNIDLITASVVTSVGVELVSRLESTLQLSFPQIKDYPSLMRALLVELPIDRTRRILDVLDFCLFFPVHTLCGFRQRVFRDMRKVGSSRIKEIEEIAAACGLKGRLFQASVARADQINEEAEFLDQYLFKLMMATEHADKTKPPNDPRLGMTAFHDNFEEFLFTAKVHTRLVFGLQVLLDTRKFLRVRRRTPKFSFQYTLRYVRSQQDNLRRDIVRLDTIDGPKSMIKALGQFIEHVDNWIEFGQFKPSGEWVDVTFPDLDKYFLTENPWHLGLVYAEMATQLFQMATYHSTLTLPPMLHLYNFLLHADNVVKNALKLEPIPLLELLCAAFEKHIFQGSRPTQGFSARLAVAGRKDLTAYASDAGRRARQSTFTAKQLEKLCLPTVMSTLHAVLADNYKLQGNTYSWLEKRDTGSTNIHTLAPAQQLDKVCEALFFDLNGQIPIARVDMILVRELSTKVRKEVYNSVRGDFVGGLGRRLGIPDEDSFEFDLTASILDIERYNAYPDVQRKIIKNTVEAFNRVCDGVKTEDYFVKMPKAKMRRWRDGSREGKGKERETKEGDERKSGGE